MTDSHQKIELDSVPLSAIAFCAVVNSICFFGGYDAATFYPPGSVTATVDGLSGAVFVATRQPNLSLHSDRHNISPLSQP
ncbi:MAG: hypothetical protein ACM37W_24025 [Actinomycetota bacterium]